MGRLARREREGKPSGTAEGTPHDSGASTGVPLVGEGVEMRERTVIIHANPNNVVIYVKFNKEF